MSNENLSSYIVKQYKKFQQYVNEFHKVHSNGLEELNTFIACVNKSKYLSKSKKKKFDD